MAQAVGRAKGWVWWLCGAVLALFFSGLAEAADRVAKYGVRPRPPRPATPRPAVTAEQRAQAEALISQYLEPPPAAPAAAPDEKTSARIDELIATLDEGGLAGEEAKKAADDLAAIGPAAKDKVRQAAEEREKKGDPEASRVAAVLRKVLARLDDAGRQAAVDGLKKLDDAARIVVREKWLEATRESQRLTSQASALAGQAVQLEIQADAAEDETKAADLREQAKKAKEQAERLRGEAGPAAKKAAALTALLTALGPVVAPIIRPPRVTPDAVAVYGIRPQAQARYAARRRPEE